MKVYLYISLLLAIILTGCKSEYDKLVAHELSLQGDNKEVFLGLENGITKKAYYQRCWELNKNQVISQGPGNQYAQYFLKPQRPADSLKTVKVLFYGIFDAQDTMRGMDMKLEFVNWAPWNKTLTSTHLASYMEQHFLDEFAGNPFIDLQVDDKVSAKVKVDKNRRIVLYPISASQVAVKFHDLRFLLNSKN